MTSRSDYSRETAINIDGKSDQWKEEIRSIRKANLRVGHLRIADVQLRQEGIFWDTKWANLIES